MQKKYTDSTKFKHFRQDWEGLIYAGKTNIVGV